MKIEFDQIQGNIFGGFNKDHAVFILLHIKLGKVAAARQTFARAELFKDTAASASDSVMRFNNQFRALRKAGVPEGSIEATWTNVVLTASGLDKLGTNLPEEAGKALPEAFLQGMYERAQKIGDTGESERELWNDGMEANDINWQDLDLMVIVASDNPQQLDETAEGSRLKKYLDEFRQTNSGLKVFKLIRGETRSDDGPRQVGHEHFGFKDGVSQPGILGVTPPDDPLANPDQGNPGQDLLKPGEFVLGYPRQAGHAAAVGNGLNPEDGPDSAEGLPSWVKNGSFLVFRRLAQDVQGFRTMVEKMAADLGTSADLLGAKLVGRYRSGAPLEGLKYNAGMGEYRPPVTDPGIANPALANNDALNNDFEYDEDEDGEIVSHAAHIRKAYPRNQVPAQEATAAFGKPEALVDGNNQPIPPHRAEAEAENRTQTHRLLRRGIPFGGSLGAAKGGGPDDPRGLLFLAYQSDINRQFEFVQTAWVNEENFPENGAGQDPIITQMTNKAAAYQMQACPFHQNGKTDKDGACPIDFKHFVRTRGGGYFFSPSIKTLSDIL